MENEAPNTAVNPLQKYFRQPKIYLKLPSSGNFYPEGTLIKTENNEYPVYAMTARDEIMIKTPDALLNGEATVSVIQSCIPNIKNAWQIPTIDMDAILIAIRIATYGEMLDLDVIIPNTEIAKTYQADLRETLDRIIDGVYDSELVINDDLTIILAPLSYAVYSKSALSTLEQQRIFSAVNTRESVSDPERLNMFNQSFKKLTEITFAMISDTVVKIKLSDGTEVTNKDHIAEFLNNADKEIFKKISQHLEKQKQHFEVPPFKVAATEEEIANGAPETFNVPIVLDTSTFFVQGSSV